MTRSLPTEESLGLSPTEEELNSVSQIGSAAEDGDDIPLDTDDNSASVEAAAAVDAEPTTPTKPEEPKTVDLRALQEARNEAREAKQSNRVLEQRLNDVLAMMQRGNVAEKQEPTKPAIPGSDDPLARLNWTADQLVAMQQDQQERAQAEQRRVQEEQEYQQIQSRVAADFEAASQTDPSLPALYNGLRESMGKELMALGYSQQQAIQHLNQTERGYVQYSYQTGIPVADLIRNVAAARGVAAQAAPVQQGGQKSQVDPKALAASQQRHMSLSDAPGGEAPPVMDAKALARMSDKEFKAWMSQKGNEAKFEQIMGGA